MPLCTVSGNINSILGAAASSGTVRFTLTNFGQGAIPMVSGSNVIVPLTIDVIVAGNGSFTVNLQGNDTITPANTLYAVTFYTPNSAVGPILYSLTGSSVNLNTATPSNITPPVLIGPQTANQVFAGPTTGSPAVPTFRPLVVADFPLSSNWAFMGNNTHSGTETFKTLNSGVILFADQFSGSDASAKIQAAINALPAIGGTVDARALTDAGGTGSTTIDPGTKAVTLLLGPGTYNFSQVILRRALHIIGAGAYPANGTIIQATGGNSTPPFVIDQSVAAQGVILRGFALQATAGNTTQNGINLVLSANSTGLWYSEFDDLYINGFGGIGLNFDSQNGQGHQFDTFKRVIVIRKASGNFALQIIGFANSFKFENCEFDGVVNTQDGLTNINIAAGVPSPVFPPYNIKFDLLTSQFAGKGFTINGADAVSIDQGHFEKVEQVFSVGTSATFGSQNITIHDSFFGNSSGVGTVGGVGVGNGYIVKNLGATANVSITIITSHSYSTPDVFLAGNTGSIVSFGNTIGPEGSYTYQPFQSGSPNGFGNGSSGTAVTTTTKGTGTGPTTPQTVVQYQQVTLSGTIYWIPLVQ